MNVEQAVKGLTADFLVTGAVRHSPRFFLPPWIATRVFRPESGEVVAVISNELDHELIRLDDHAARLWGVLADAIGGASEADVATALPELDAGETRAFLSELTALNLLATEPNPAPVALQRDEFAEAPTSGRYAGGSYVEAAPGGDNLLEEFELQDWALERGYLWSAAWEMTYRCNESCVHCFNPGASHGPGEKSNRKVAEVSFDEAKKLLTEMRDLGVFRLLLTGGEVLLRKDFFDVMAEARRLGMSVTVFTNGTLLDEAKIDRLAALYPHRVELTLYSTAQKHDAITRLKGSFDKTLAAAKALIARGVTVSIKSSLMRDTAFDHRELRRLCDEIGCEYTPDFNMSAGVDGARSPITQLMMEAEALIANALDATTPLWVGTLEQPNRIDLEVAQGQPVCGAGRSLMNISAEGNISPCNSLPLYMGHVREEGLAQVWAQGKLARQARGDAEASDDTLSRWQDVVRGKYHVCGTFQRCAWCQKCPGMAYLETGDELAPSHSNCRTAAARRIAFDLIEAHGVEDAASYIHVPLLQSNYADETALWSSAAVEQTISLKSVQDILRRKTRATALGSGQETATGTSPVNLDVQEKTTC